MRCSSGLKAVLKAAPVVITGALMLIISWRKWADLIVDYGREVYIPWQISQGSLLYRDIASFYGPLSSYWNSFLFRLFGETLFPIQFFNILLIALLTYFIYRLFEREDDSIAPAVLASMFIILFALGKHFNLGSYNYVAPYSHELVHGVFLSFAAIYTLKLYIRKGRLFWALVTGLFTGLVLLTKMEIAFGLVLAIIPGFAFALWGNGGPGRERSKASAILFIAGTAVPVLLFIGYFSLYMGPVGAFRSVFSSWSVVAGTGISSSKFYKAVTGIDNLSVNIRGMLTAASWFLFLLVPLVINYLLRKNQFARRYGGFISFAVVGALMVYFAGRIPWDLIFWPLPLFMAVIVLFFGVKLLRGKYEDSARTIPLFVLSVFAAALLLKIVFVTRVYGYGFVLAMPATLITCYMLLSYVPASLDRRWGSSSILRYSVLAALVVMLAVYSIKSYRLYEMQDYAVGEGGDTLITSGYSGGKGVEILLEQIDKVMAPEDDFIVMPEGTLVNYLSRRKNPTKFVTFLPTDITIYGEDRMLAALADTPPDYIILISRDTIEYGVHYLGQGYGDRIYAFIMNGYEGVVRIGNLGFLEESTGMGQPLGMLIMKRRGGE
jgi:hypothetical protein